MTDLVKTLWQLIRKESSIRRVAKELEIDRASLYRSLNGGTHPRIDTVMKILDHLGYELQVVKANKKTRKVAEGTEQQPEEMLDKGRESRPETA